MTSFQNRWIEIARRFQLTVRTDVWVGLDEEHFVAPILLENFGAGHGMVLVTEYAAIRPFTQRLVAAGFGYSCLPETGKKEVDEAIDDASIIEVLRDWSWSGPGSPPAWLSKREHPLQPLQSDGRVGRFAPSRARR